MFDRLKADRVLPAIIIALGIVLAGYFMGGGRYELHKLQARVFRVDTLTGKTWMLHKPTPEKSSYYWSRVEE